MDLYLPYVQWRRNEVESGRGAHVWKFFFSCPSAFIGSTSTISRFDGRFRDVLYSLISLLFAVQLTVPPAICKSGGAPVPYVVGALWYIRLRFPGLEYGDETSTNS